MYSNGKADTSRNNCGVAPGPSNALLQLPKTVREATDCSDGANSQRRSDLTEKSMASFVLKRALSPESTELFLCIDIRN